MLAAPVSTCVSKAEKGSCAFLSSCPRVNKPILPHGLIASSPSHYKFLPGPRGMVVSPREERREDKVPHPTPRAETQSTRPGVPASTDAGSSGDIQHSAAAQA